VVSTRYADLLTEVIERCMQAKRELTLHWDMGETAQLPEARIRLRGNLGAAEHPRPRHRRAVPCA
jgi:hypothetical protein